MMKYNADEKIVYDIMKRSDTSIEICDTRFFTLGNIYWIPNPSNNGTNKQNANQSVYIFFTEIILSKISLNVSNQNGTITAIEMLK